MTATAPPSRSTRRVLTTVLVVLALALAGVVAVGVLAYCSVLGCTFHSEDFQPRGAAATAARARAVAQVRALADELVAGREVIAGATADGCSTGQDNWKRKDTYSHECSVLDSRVVLVTTDHEAVGEGLTAADSALRRLGCTPGSWGGLDRVRAEYWQPGNPQVDAHGAAGLPSASYTCGRGITVDAAPTSAQELHPNGAVALASPFLDEPLSTHWYSVDDVRSLRGSGAQLALVLTVREGYYRTRF